IRTHSGAEGISQVDVSKHLIVTPANMTKLIDKLEKEKLVTRSPLEGDRRVNILRVTKRAEELLDGLWPKYNGKMKQLMGNLSINDQKDVASKLIKWLGVLLDN
ncbi:MAG: MarR family transcriptional regulator, partial [Candidatus Omnitrophica bacterium]|nr:MarR family transcriptional regulator [Candidatus Omnitrophota bacterium]